MIEFEVMIRPIKALQALGEEMGNRIGPQLSLLKQAAAAPALTAAPFEGLAGSRALARSGALWQGSARPVGAFSGRFSYPGTLP